MIVKFLRDDLELAIALLVGVLLVAGAIYSGVRDQRAQDRCTDAGGVVERYDSQTILVSTSCGEGCTTLVPFETSRWRCRATSAGRP